MPILPLHGHSSLRARLLESIDRERLPASLLLHGPRGVGKQRLALWLGQVLLCAEESRPCDECRSCRQARELTHPDLHWFFPRPRLKDADASLADVREDYAEAIAARVAARGLYAPPSGSEAIYVTAVRVLVQSAGMTPAMGRRKVFVIGDAERMVAQEGADQAANALLKVLEEPRDDTTIILTSSEPGALLPTIRSRVVAVRVAALPDAEVQQFLRDRQVGVALDGAGVPAAARQRPLFGAPGSLLGSIESKVADDGAERLLAAATGRDRAVEYRLAFVQGSSRARGAFSDTLDSLTVLLHQRARTAVARHDERSATASARAVDAVERARSRASGNVSPQLVSARLLREMAELFA